MTTKEIKGTVTVPTDFKFSDDLIVGYANAPVVDRGDKEFRDLIPADTWLKALQMFFQRGSQVNLLHRPIIVAETVKVEVNPGEGPILYTRPLKPWVKDMIDEGILKGYSIEYSLKDFDVLPSPDFDPRPIRKFKDFSVARISYVDEPMNPQSYFRWGGKMGLEGYSFIFDKENSRVTVEAADEEAFARLAQLFDEGLKAAEIPTDGLKAIEFKMAGEKAEWAQAYINDLPDSAFAYIESGGKKDTDGKTTPRGKRYLPYKGADGKVDPAHLRNALSRLKQTDLSSEARSQALGKLCSAAKGAGIESDLCSQRKSLFEKFGDLLSLFGIKEDYMGDKKDKPDQLTELKEKLEALTEKVSGLKVDEETLKGLKEKIEALEKDFTPDENDEGKDVKGRIEALEQKQEEGEQSLAQRIEELKGSVEAVVSFLEKQTNGATHIAPTDTKSATDQKEDFWKGAA